MLSLFFIGSIDFENALNNGKEGVVEGVEGNQKLFSLGVKDELAVFGEWKIKLALFLNGEKIVVVEFCLKAIFKVIVSLFLQKFFLRDLFLLPIHFQLLNASLFGDQKDVTFFIDLNAGDRLIVCVDFFAFQCFTPPVQQVDIESLIRKKNGALEIIEIYLFNGFGVGCFAG